MKILFITNNFPPVVDGVGDYTANLSHSFSTKGYEVYVICATQQEPYSRILLNPNLQVLPIFSGWTITSIYHMIKEIRSIHPDYISLQYVPYSFDHYGMPYRLAVVALVLRLYRYKILTTFHEIAIRLDYKNMKAVVVGINQRIIAYLLALLSHSCITSTELYHQMLGFLKHKVYRIPIGSNIPLSQVSSEQIDALKKKLKPKDEFLICAFGINAKRYDLLLRVIAELMPVYNVKLLLIGKLPEAVIHQIQTQAEQLKITTNLIVTGYLRPEEVYLHLLCADVFLQLENILYKNWGGVSTKSGTLAAAYMAGLPIIGTKGDMTDDFFLDGENILLCSSSNSLSEITSKIITLIKSEKLRKDLRKNSYKTFLEKLQWEQTFERYNQIMHI